jgi:DNA polymerase III subunit gamma/tau
MLKKVWMEYAEIMKNEGRKSESIIMDRDFTMEGEFTVKLGLDNFVQLDVFNVFKADLLRHLRQGLNNSNVNVDAEIAEAAPSKKIYTANDKFRYLSEKFPLLEEMKKRFGLDSDF